MIDNTVVTYGDMKEYFDTKPKTPTRRPNEWFSDKNKRVSPIGIPRKVFSRTKPKRKNFKAEKENATSAVDNTEVRNTQTGNAKTGNSNVKDIET